MIIVIEDDNCDDKGDDNDKDIQGARLLSPSTHLKRVTVLQEQG